MNLEIDELTSHFELRDEATVSKDVAEAVTEAVHDAVESTSELDSPPAEASPIDAASFDSSIAGET